MSRTTVVVGQYVSAVPVVTSDTVPLTVTAAGLFVTTAGNLVFIDEAGNTNTVTAATIGQIYPIRTSQIKATGTTATVSALYY